MPFGRASSTPSVEDKADLFSNGGPRFLITVDIEEDFNSQLPRAPFGYSTESIADIEKFQILCEENGIVPAYLIDYPAAQSAVASDILSGPLSQGRAELGIHLHPWVNPPHDENLSNYNSFAGNLPACLERAKFERLRDLIQKNFGVVPRIFRAGRYGIGPNTAEILSDNGILIDTSVHSRFDHSASGGPNFSAFPPIPYWIDCRRALLEIPITTVFGGVLRSHGPWLYPLLWHAPFLPGLLARFGFLERISLSCEATPIDKALEAIDIALAQKLPILNFSFKPSALRSNITEGPSPLCDSIEILKWWSTAITHLNERNIEPISVSDISDIIESKYNLFRI